MLDVIGCYAYMRSMYWNMTLILWSIISGTENTSAILKPPISSTYFLKFSSNFVLFYLTKSARLETRSTKKGA